MRGGSGIGEIAPVKAILCQFALQSLVIACPYALPAIFECTGGEESVYYVCHHLNLILHGKLSMQDQIYMLKIESTSGVPRQNYSIFKCTGGEELVHLNIHVITYIRYNMESQACKFKFTCLKLNLGIFDITWQLISNLP